MVALKFAVMLASALGDPDLVLSQPAPGAFPLVNLVAAPLLTDEADWPGVVRAAHDLSADIGRVTGRCPEVVATTNSTNVNLVIIGTLGKSKWINQLIRAQKIDVAAMAGKWESFFLQVVPQPLPGVENALVICGSDKRGTIYGIYELSEQIGVSPWYFWADVPAKHQDRLFVKAGKLAEGPPQVKYRGIFLNDEAPDLSGWVREQYGAVPGRPGVANYGRGFYTNVFELMLRIRANYLWPAMWNNAFNEDDPENPRLADEYGIVMGTSHQEPMLRAQQEWDRGPGRTQGRWNYNLTNQQPVLRQFWRAGVRRNRNFESIITLGLRAENDQGTPIGRELTGQIITDQRNILAGEISPDLTQIPQMWCLYKEVQDYYQLGLSVPDDVTLLWADDNWGNLRRVPTPRERERGGGAGVYYHFDYHGGPRNYQWINTSPISKIWDQMSLAAQYGANRIWVVNVGHFKGYEFPMEFFMSLGWDPARWTNENLEAYARQWAGREFGPDQADEIAGVLLAGTQLNARCKPELLEGGTYSLVNYGEWERVLADYETLAARAARIAGQLPSERRDAYSELVQFPIQAAAGLNAMYLAAAKNHLYARQGRFEANAFAAQTRQLFALQTSLMAWFNHTLAGGRWDHFMDQPYIGYTGWNEPPTNTLAAARLVAVSPPDVAALGVAAEGSETAVTNGELSLPPFDAYNRQRRYLDAFNRGTTPFELSLTADHPWIVTDGVPGTLQTGHRIWVSVDWDKVPAGDTTGMVKLTGAGGAVTVNLRVSNPPQPTRAGLDGFVEGDGCVSMEAEHYTRKTDTGANHWIKVPYYGNTLSAMRATGPVDVEAIPGNDSPCLEYKMFLFHPGPVDVEVMVGPTLNFLPERSLRYALSFDQDPPQTVTLVPAGFKAQNGNREWETSVKDNGRHSVSAHEVATPGYHTLKLWMVDPAVAVEKIVVNTGGVRPSYLGPPESYRGNGDGAMTGQPN